MKKARLEKKQQVKVDVKSQQPYKKVAISTTYFHIIGLIVVCLLGSIIYSNSFDCTFHFDDAGSIVDNVKIREMDLKTIWTFSHNRFMAYVTFAINYHYGALNVWGYHLVNLIIHLITSCLVYWFTVLLFATPAMKANSSAQHKNTIALFTALLFVSHPLATQSVTYIVQRMASMVALFYLLSLALYVKARLTESGSKSKYLLFGGSLISIVLAMLTKENAYTLPFALVLMELYFFQTKKLSINFKDYRFTLILLGLVVFVLAVLNSFSFGLFNTIPPDSFNDYQTVTAMNYLLTQFSVLVKYIQLLMLPVNQNFDYYYLVSNSFFEAKTMLCFLAIFAMLLMGVLLFNKSRLVSFCILWFFLTMAVESSIIPLSDLIFEHRTYLPSFGFFLLISYGLFGLLWDKYKILVCSVFACVIGTNSYLTFERNKVWKNDLTFWGDAVNKSPLKARPHFNLANTFYKENNLKEALLHFNEVVKLKPNYVGVYYNRAILFEKQNNNSLAILDYNKALAINPTYIQAYFNRGNAYKNDGKLDEAMKDYTKVISLKPDFAKAYYNRSIIYVNQKKLPEAIADLTKLIALNTEDATESYYNRGMAAYFADQKETGCNDLQVAAKAGYQPAVAALAQFCK